MASLTSRQHDELVGLRVGNYRLERVLGHGRMGVVYLARDIALLRATAVKVLSWDFEYTFGTDPTAWFLDEARHVAQINHPRVIQIYAAAKQDDNCYIAMEFVNGPSAEDLIVRDGPLSVERATRIIVDVASALQAAHDAGVVHRDVKPANILVSDADGWAKLGDFGMSLSTRSLKAGRGRVQAGTPYYTAPELWQGALASTSSDIYALGATYYYLLTGKYPFAATSTSELRKLHLVAALPDPRRCRPNIPHQAVEVIEKAMAKKTCLRFESASALCQQALSLLPQIGATYSLVEREVRTRRSEPPSAGALAVPVSRFLREFQFVRRPFSAEEPPEPQAEKHPWASVLSGMESHLSAGSTTLSLAGRAGTGRSTLLRALTRRLRATRNVLLVKQAPNATSGQLLQGLSLACGNTGGTFQEVLERLCDAKNGKHLNRCHPVIIIDEVSPATISEVAALENLRQSKGLFSMIICEEQSLRNSFSTIVCESYTLRALNLAECSEHVCEWLRATRPAYAPPLLFSPDALLVLFNRSEGVTALLNRLALNALALAASQSRRVVTSFEAFYASAQEDWVHADCTVASELPTRPYPWPTPRAFEELQTLKALDLLHPENSRRTSPF